MGRAVNSMQRMRRFLVGRPRGAAPPSLLAAALLLSLSLVRADVPKLQPRGFTNDYAGVMSSAGIRRTDALAGELQRKTGVQIAVVIVKSLDDNPIEDYANTLARRWGIGQKKENRGVLLLLAVQDRRDRLEVGYGLEPILPDGKVGGILRDMRAYLRAGNYDAAILYAVNEIATAIAKDAGVALEGQTYQRPPTGRRRQQGPGLPLWVLLLGGAGILWLILKAGINPLFLLWGMSGWGGSGRGGGDGGGKWDGGGFSGFGGAT